MPCVSQRSPRRTSALAHVLVLSAVVVLAGFVSGACRGWDDDTDVLTVYSGRSRELVQPILGKFEKGSGVEVQVRYGSTSELASLILEEGPNSPADVFFAQDAGGLGVLGEQGLLVELPRALLEQVDPRFRASDGEWVGISGRARVVAYNTERVSESDLPDSILGFADPTWAGRIGWAPANASFQAFITGMREELGDERTGKWLRGVLNNRPRAYPRNTPIIDALGRGEVDVGFVNHYYLLRFREERGEDFPVENHHLRGGDPGALINVAGVGILQSSAHPETAEELVSYLLSDLAQEYFANETQEYPLAAGVSAHPDLVPLTDLDPPEIDLGSLADLADTLDLLRDTGVLD